MKRRAPPFWKSKWEFAPGYEPKGWECNARRRDGHRCTKTARKQKDKCQNHGGANPIKHGLRSKYLRESVADLLQAMEDDPKLLDIRRQAAILAALQTGRLSQLEDLGQATQEDVEALRHITDSLVKAIAQYERVQRAPENWVPIEVMGRLAAAIAEAINTHVPDAAARKRILDQLDRGLNLATPTLLQ